MSPVCIEPEALPEVAAPPAIEDPERIAGYLEDAAHYPGGHSPALYRPSSEAELAAILRATAPAPVLVSGARSSLTGGATPRGEIVLSLEKLRTAPVLEGERVRAGAACTVAELQAALAERGRYYPPVPTYEGATVGGVCATNAAGAATFKYGQTRPWVAGLRVLLADGRCLSLERGSQVAGPEGFSLRLPDGELRPLPVPSYPMAPVPKQSAGYFSAGEGALDAVDLFVGAEGTLGIVTDVSFNTVPAPAAVFAGLLVAPTEALAIEACGEMRVKLRPGLRAIEHLDAACLNVLREDGIDRRLRIPLAPEGTEDPDPVALLFEIELAAQPSAEDIDHAFAGEGGPPELQQLLDLLAAIGLSDRLLHAAFPGDTAALARMHRLREAVPEGVNRRVAEARNADPAVSKLAADMIVPFERFAQMQQAYRDAFDEAGLRYAIWGHISDGNVHPNVLARSADDMARGKTAILALGRQATALGGCPLSEHGVGRNPIKQALLRQHHGDAAIAQMRALKAALDPDWRLAPGVLFPAPEPRR